MWAKSMNEPRSTFVFELEIIRAQTSFKAYELLNKIKFVYFKNGLV